MLIVMIIFRFILTTPREPFMSMVTETAIELNSLVKRKHGWGSEGSMCRKHGLMSVSLKVLDRGFSFHQSQLQSAHPWGRVTRSNAIYRDRRKRVFRFVRRLIAFDSEQAVPVCLAKIRANIRWLPIKR